ncbi:MAG TPA: shikimate kinase, partial [bacterium]|nr:shikimate kinase [bacterium]
GDGAGPAPRARVIALVGLRGAGKSTIGRRLAERLHRPFVELDQLVESAAGLKLEEIFALHGDAFYRRLETATLEAFFRDRPEAVLATGGGIVTNAQAFGLLKELSTVVWLKATVDEHWSRVVRQGDRRPMRANPRAKAELKALLRTREPLYRQADRVVDTSELGVAGSVEALARALPGASPVSS